MTKRIGVVGIVVEKKDNIKDLNNILSLYSSIIIGRMGLPNRGAINVISLIVEGSNDEIGALTGKLGNLDGIKVRSALTNYVITEE